MTELILTDNITTHLQSLDSKKIVIGFSGGPDSVATYRLISDYYNFQGWNLDDIYLAHYNHKFRSESDGEAEFIKKNYRNIIYGEYTGNTFSERDLRIARHIFFKDCLDKAQTRTLALGHNLSDRFETTIMNIQRGAGSNGIANMQEIDEKEYLLITKYTIIRPILLFPKNIVSTYCDTLGLHYFTDPTNNDPTISERNVIRNRVIKPLEKGNNGPLQKRWDEHSKAIFEKYGHEYYCIEEFFYYRLDGPDVRDNLKWRYDIFYSNGGGRIPILIKKIKLPIHSGYDYIYKCANIFYEDDIIRLLKGINEYHDITKEYLQELLHFIKNNDHGFKEIGGRKLYICHDWIYLINENKQFNAGQVLGFWLQYDDSIIRLVDLQTDIYNGKPVNKRFINNKIPVFLRHIVPVDRDGRYKDDLIIQLLHNSQ